MEKPDDLPEWKDADRISDRIIDMANEEVRKGTSPLQIFAGIMLGMLGFLRAAPPERPVEMIGVEAAIHLCLNAMIETKRHLQ
jgi:hypothetical protein